MIALPAPVSRFPRFPSAALIWPIRRTEGLDVGLAGLGALGVVVGLLTGGLVSLILIRVVNRQSFHWSMDLAIPGVALVWLSAALIAAAALIAVVSGRSAMRGDVIAAVKEDW